MASWGVWAAVFVLVVAFLNLIPVAYELILSVLQSRGYKLNYQRLVHFSRTLNRTGLVGEYGLVVVVLLLIWGAIYLHAFVYYPFYQIQNNPSWLSWVILHFLPSLLLNSNMLYNFYICM